MNSVPIKHNIFSIGIFRCEQKYRYDLPRQGVLQQSRQHGKINLHGEINFTQALQNLDGFERIWLTFGFHHNENFSHMVDPPRHSSKKVGVFASRSPHRPNALGLSCVKLEEINFLKKSITVSEYDLIDETPIYDIKPYLPYCDSFPHAQAGWTQTTTEEKKYQVSINDFAFQRMNWLKENHGICVANFVNDQLSYEPNNHKKKRIKKINENKFILSYRTWRILFELNNLKKKVSVVDLKSGYSKADLSTKDDKYEDKKLHREYQKKFGF